MNNKEEQQDIKSLKQNNMIESHTHIHTQTDTHTNTHTN